MKPQKDRWGTRVGLILAMAGNAVGLGNFLRFPVQAVQNGGGAFIIPYLICFFLMGIPLLWIEWSMGRYGGKFGNHSTPFILEKMARRNSFWKYFGVFGIFTNVAVAAYYCYIESWTLSYVFHSIGQTFVGMDMGQVASFFGQYVDMRESTFGIPYEAVVFYLIVLVLNIYILSRGLKDGVEKAAKIGMPLLILFGIILAIRGLTLGSTGAPAGCEDCDAFLGLNYLWQPQLDSLANPKVWMAAAGQIFFTLSVGMGTIQCYAAYVRENDDIALNAMSAGWMNGFVEVVLGASIVIPISVGFLGLDWVLDNVGFSTAFQTMPYLFQQWGQLFGTLAGVMWFGLLFFAGITSSLAMGTPWMGFMRDEFNWGRVKSAVTFGIIVLIVGLPTVLFFQNGVFDEYDYWAGTVSLVIFALAESIIFSWVFGINNAWDELNQGSEIKIAGIFKPILKYITPLFLVFVFIGSLITPKGNDWLNALNNGWELDESSIIGKLQHKSIVFNRGWFADYFEADTKGKIAFVKNLDDTGHDESTKGYEVGISQTLQYYYDDKQQKVKRVPENLAEIAGANIIDSSTVVKTYSFRADKKVLVKPGDEVTEGTKIAEGSFINSTFYLDLARMILVALFVFLCVIVYRASQLRKKIGRED